MLVWKGKDRAAHAAYAPRCKKRQPENCADINICPAKQFSGCLFCGGCGVILLPAGW